MFSSTAGVSRDFKGKFGECVGRKSWVISRFPIACHLKCIQQEYAILNRCDFWHPFCDLSYPIYGKLMMTIFYCGHRTVIVINVIGRLKNDQRNLELVQLHSWDRDHKIKQNAFTVLGLPGLWVWACEGKTEGGWKQQYSDVKSARYNYMLAEKNFNSFCFFYVHCINYIQ